MATAKKRVRRDAQEVLTVTVNPIEVTIDGKAMKFNATSAMEYWNDRRKDALDAEASVQHSTYQKSEALRLAYIAICIRAHFEPTLSGEQAAKEYYGNWATLAKSTKDKTKSNFGAMIDGARANLDKVVSAWPKGNDVERKTAMTQDAFYARCRAVRDVPNGSEDDIKKAISARNKAAKSKLGDHVNRFLKGINDGTYKGDDNWTTVKKAVETFEALIKEVKFDCAVKPE